MFKADSPRLKFNLNLIIYHFITLVNNFFKKIQKSTVKI